MPQPGGRAAGRRRRSELVLDGAELRPAVSSVSLSACEPVSRVGGPAPNSRRHGRTGAPAHGLTDFYFSDPRLTLLPLEHLSPAGMSGDLARLLAEFRGWSAERIALFDAAFASLLAAQRRARAPHAPLAVAASAPRRGRGRSARGATLRAASQHHVWTLYDCDLDPALSHPELVAYLLVHGDRMALLGEVTLAAVHNAAYWFERDAAPNAPPSPPPRHDRRGRTPRPSALSPAPAGGCASWRTRRCDRPCRPSAHRAIPGTGLARPAAIEKEPPLLVDRWQGVARGALAAFHDRWRAPDPRARSPS